MNEELKELNRQIEAGEVFVEEEIYGKFLVRSIYHEKDPEIRKKKFCEIWIRHLNRMANEDFNTKDVVYFYMNENDEIATHPSLEWDSVTSNWHNNMKKLKNRK